MTRPLGLLGGAFDPVHCGHLHFARTCSTHVGLNAVRLVPLNTPPHRAQPVASARLRLEMLKLATEDYPECVIDDCEIQRGGVSYTIDTLQALRQAVGSTPICLLIGEDNFGALYRWHKWRSLLDYAHIIIARRPQQPPVVIHADLQTILAAHKTDAPDTLHRRSAGCIMSLDMTMPNISSTRIRDNFSTAHNNTDLLPAKVLDFIRAHHLYGT